MLQSWKRWEVDCKALPQAKQEALLVMFFLILIWLVFNLSKNTNQMKNAFQGNQASKSNLS